MKLFVLRHGNAEPFAASDYDRALTSRGTLETQAIVAEMKDELSSVTSIYASPYVRAQQTADLVSQSLGVPFETTEILVPEGSVHQVSEFLGTLPNDEVPLLVTHQPFVGGFVDWLCDLDPGRHVMGTSALVSLSVDVLARGCAQLMNIKQP